MGKEKALEICRNLKGTIRKYNNNSTVGKSSVKDNSIWISTKASKSMLERKLLKLIKEYKINNKEL